jgi:hypothetical protein
MRPKNEGGAERTPVGTQKAPRAFMPQLAEDSSSNQNDRQVKLLITGLPAVTAELVRFVS